MHGGSAPQTLARASQRLAALEISAIAAIGELIRHADSDAVRLGAAKWLLEVRGHKAMVQVQGDHEITIRVIDEAQPIVIEQGYERNGRTYG